jgi:hypothetical protein
MPGLGFPADRTPPKQRKNAWEIGTKAAAPRPHGMGGVATIQNTTATDRAGCPCIQRRRIL